jgi:hypothetical protein
MRIGTYTSIKLYNKQDVKALLTGFNAAFKYIPVRFYNNNVTVHICVDLTFMQRTASGMTFSANSVLGS